MQKTKLVTAALATVVAAFAVAPAAHAADDYFLKIDGMTGESVGSATKGAIAVNSFELGVENPTTIGSATGGAGVGKATFNKLTIEKTVDSTSPLLMQKVATGEKIRGMELVARKAGATGGTTYMRWAFQPVYVTSQKHAASSGDEAATETLTFVYGAMQESYTKQTAAGTPAPAPILRVWNQVTNTDNPIAPGGVDLFGTSNFS